MTAETNYHKLGSLRQIYSLMGVEAHVPLGHKQGVSRARIQEKGLLLGFSSF